MSYAAKPASITPVITAVDAAVFKTLGGAHFSCFPTHFAMLLATDLTDSTVGADACHTIAFFTSFSNMAVLALAKNEGETVASSLKPFRLPRLTKTSNESTRTINHCPAFAICSE